MESSTEARQQTVSRCPAESGAGVAECQVPGRGQRPGSTKKPFAGACLLNWSFPLLCSASPAKSEAGGGGGLHSLCYKR
jgi:hypothetical protein